MHACINYDDMLAASSISSYSCNNYNFDYVRSLDQMQSPVMVHSNGHLKPKNLDHTERNPTRLSV